MRQKQCFFLLTLWFTIFKLNAQEVRFKNKLYLESFYHYGFVTPHHNYMAYFVKDHIQSFQLNLGIHTSGEKLWHKFYNNPSFGVGFHYTTLSNKVIYGHMSAIYLYADRYFRNNDRILNFGNRISLGGCYVNKRFDLYSDPFNLAISTNINIYINYSLEADIRLLPKTNLKFGLGVSHISNGNIKEPNKGINFITSFVGLKYSFSDPKNIRHPYSFSEPDSSKNQFIVSGSLGLKNISRFTNVTYSIYALSLEYSRKINRSGWLGLVLNNYYDNSLKQELENENSSYVYKSTDKIRTTLNLSYEMKMGDLSFLFQPGIYIRNKYTHFGLMSNRMGIRYTFADRYTASFMIKAHWLAIADFIEWGVGYKLTK